MVCAVEWKNGVVCLLDQRRLPLEVVYVACTDVEMVARGISEMWVRGAPAIGIAAAYGIVLAAQSIDTDRVDDLARGVTNACDRLAATRPTAVSLFHAVARMRTVTQDRSHHTPTHMRAALLAEAHALLREDVAGNHAIAKAGAALVPDGAGILTHCNTGSLATGGYGTALGVIRRAWEMGKKIHVYADETRPVLQGARLTMWELIENQIPATLIADNMAASLMRRGKIQCCVVGADRIAANGDVANKIGTYGVAVLARAHGIPFYVAAPTSTIDASIPSGDAIPIEERDPQEVTHIGGVRIAPVHAAAVNPAFDITPACYITAIVTEKGVIAPHAIGALG